MDALAQWDRAAEKRFVREALEGVGRIQAAFGVGPAGTAHIQAIELLELWARQIEFTEGGSVDAATIDCITDHTSKIVGKITSAQHGTSENKYPKMIAMAYVLAPTTRDIFPNAMKVASQLAWQIDPKATLDRLQPGKRPH